MGGSRPRLAMRAAVPPSQSNAPDQGPGDSSASSDQPRQYALYDINYSGIRDLPTGLQQIQRLHPPLAAQLTATRSFQSPVAAIFFAVQLLTIIILMAVASGPPAEAYLCSSKTVSILIVLSTILAVGALALLATFVYFQPGSFDLGVVYTSIAVQVAALIVGCVFRAWGAIALFISISLIAACYLMGAQI
jgi:hypothetical protein